MLVSSSFLAFPIFTLSRCGCEVASSALLQSTGDERRHRSCGPSGAVCRRVLCGIAVRSYLWALCCVSAEFYAESLWPQSIYVFVSQRQMWHAAPDMCLPLSMYMLLSFEER